MYFSKEGFSLQVPLSLFRLRFSSKVVYKINKSAILHPLQVVYKVIVYLNDFLEEIILSRHTVIYLLQNIGFVINLK